MLLIHNVRLIRMRTVRSFLIVAALLTAAFAAQDQPAQPAAPATALPSGQEIIAFLNQSIDWHRRIATEEQIATDASDASFLDDNKQISVQVLRLGFDFARAAAQAGAGSAQAAVDAQNAQPSGNQALAAAFTRAQNDLKQTQAEFEADREKLATATTKDRRQLQATVDEL